MHASHCRLLLVAAMLANLVRSELLWAQNLPAVPPNHLVMVIYLDALG
jgi:hypothetical protein